MHLLSHLFLKQQLWNVDPYMVRGSFWRSYSGYAVIATAIIDARKFNVPVRAFC
jgi:hypothetical protein